MGANLFLTPEEFRNHVQMNTADANIRHHDLNDLLERLTDKDLVIFDHLLGGIYSAPVEMASSISGYWLGRLEGILQSRGICPTHLVRHDDEINKMLDKESQESQTDPVNGDVFGDFTSPTPGQENDQVKFQFEANTPPPRPNFPFNPLTVQAMTEYHLEDAWDEAGEKFLGFACSKGCGMMYPSIADRMLNLPDDCSGCYHRSAHG